MNKPEPHATRRFRSAMAAVDKAQRSLNGMGLACFVTMREQELAFARGERRLAKALADAIGWASR